MADEIDIVISYKSERRAVAGHLADILKLHGYSVWFDYHLIKGKDFRLQISGKIEQAKALVVLWCSLSVKSRWVIDEADLGDSRDILIPAVIEPCSLPVGFRCQDYIDLSAWDGAPRSHQLDRLIVALEQRIGRPAQINLDGIRKYEEIWRRFGSPPLSAFPLDKPLADVEGDRQVSQAETEERRCRAPAERQAQEKQKYNDNNGQKKQVRPAPSTVGDRDFGRPAQGAVSAKRDPGEEALLELARLVIAGEQQAREQKFRAEGRIPVLPGGGEPFRDLDGGPEMVVVPAGKFMMGSPDDEAGRSEDEGPQHEVTIAYPFAIGRYAVTRGEFKTFVQATQHETNDKWLNPGFSQEDDHPVVSIGWNDAQAYAAWLTETTGRPYRLPTEAEWEYAARAGTMTAFWWGPSFIRAHADYSRDGTMPVGKFKPNPWGLYDVHGNVWEWCEDTWRRNYRGAPADGSARNPADAPGWLAELLQRFEGRVVRGGSWADLPGPDFPVLLRAAARYGRSNPRNSLGFRVARTLPPL